MMNGQYQKYYLSYEVIQAILDPVFDDACLISASWDPSP